VKFGLSEKQIIEISKLLSNEGVSKAVIFGSRAKGNYRDNSDIDIAVWGEGLNISKISAELDELSMPYKFDLVDYVKITKVALLEHIDRVGEIFCEKI
jgi:predicted nucleotidyltransferase